MVSSLVTGNFRKHDLFQCLLKSDIFSEPSDELCKTSFILYHGFVFLVHYSSACICQLCILFPALGDASPWRQGCLQPAGAGEGLPKFLKELIKLLSVKLTKPSVLQRTLGCILIPHELCWVSQERSSTFFLWVIIPRLNELFGICGVLDVLFYSLIL